MDHTEFFRKESELPAFLPYPRFLLNLDLSMTAKAVYALLLNRTTLSQKNGWVDEEGKVFINYSINHLAHDIGRSETAIKTALKDLESADLLCKQRMSFQGPNRIYLKCDFSQLKHDIDQDEPPSGETAAFRKNSDYLRRICEELKEEAV